MRYALLSIIIIFILVFLGIIYFNKKELFDVNINRCNSCVGDGYPDSYGKLGVWDINGKKCRTYTNSSNDHITKLNEFKDAPDINKQNYILGADFDGEGNWGSDGKEIIGCDNLKETQYLIDLSATDKNRNLVLKKNLFVNYTPADIEKINKLKGLDLENKNNLVVNKTRNNQPVLEISDKLCIGDYCITADNARNINGQIDSPGFFEKQSPASDDNIMLYNHDKLDEVPKSLCITNINDKLILNNTADEDRFIVAANLNIDNELSYSSKINSRYGLIYKHIKLDTGADEGIYGIKQDGYRGEQDKTIYGLPCQKWTDQSPYSHDRTPANYPNKGLGDHNHCRNPDGEPEGIWCYTTKSKRWDYCDPIPVPTLPMVPYEHHDVILYLRLDNIRDVYGVAIQVRGDGVQDEWTEKVSVEYLDIDTLYNDMKKKNKTEEEIEKTMAQIKTYTTFTQFAQLASYMKLACKDSTVFTEYPKHINDIKKILFTDDEKKVLDKEGTDNKPKRTNLIKVTGSSTNIMKENTIYNYPSMRLDVYIKGKHHNCLTAEHLEMMNGTRGVRLYNTANKDIADTEDDYIMPYYIDYSTGERLGIDSVKSGNFYKKRNTKCDVLGDDTNKKESCISYAFELEGQMLEKKIQTEKGIKVVPNFKYDNHSCSDNGPEASIHMKLTDNDKNKRCSGDRLNTEEKCVEISYCKWDGGCKYKPCVDNKKKSDCAESAAFCKWNETKCDERIQSFSKNPTKDSDDYNIKKYLPSVFPKEGKHFSEDFYYNNFNQPYMNFKLTPASRDVKGSTMCNETISGDKGNGYRGCQNKTISGKTCQKWTDQSPHSHENTPSDEPDKGLGSHNYCRNPDGEPGGIWCYTTDKDERWEYCRPATAKTSGAVDKSFYHGHYHSHDDNANSCSDTTKITQDWGMDNAHERTVCKNT